MKKLHRGGAIDYSIDDVEKILSAGTMSKDAVRILMENARAKKEIQVPENNQVMDMFRVILEQQQQFMKSVIAEIRQDKPVKQAQLLLPEVPDIEPRAYLRHLVKSIDMNKDKIRDQFRVEVKTT